nr:NYN domain-containing protein [Sinorhizobium medicae]
MIEDLEFSSVRPSIDLLDLHGCDQAGKEFTGSHGRRKIKGSMDIELAIDAIEQSQTADHLVPFSWGWDFTTLIEALQR